MRLQEKLNNLGRIDNLVWFRWTAKRARIARNYILLSDIRLNSLTCHEGEIVYSSAAPIMYMKRGQSIIQFRDSDVLTLTSGRRAGINISCSHLQEGETGVEATHCEHRRVVGEDCPKWLENKILSMGNGFKYPYADFVMPSLFRMTRDVETLKPNFNAEVLEQIGGKADEGLESLKEKFTANQAVLGTYTDEGFVIPNEYINSGGVCVVAAKGIASNVGSIVHQLALRSFIEAIRERGWSITTANMENSNEVARIANSQIEETYNPTIDGNEWPE